MSKWTPGTWRMEEIGTSEDGGVFQIVSTEQAAPIAEFVVYEDARLIAAAPEMADELSHICDLLDSAFEQGISIPGLATTNKARALLARVEGK